MAEYYCLMMNENNPFPKLKSWYQVVNPRYLNRESYQQIPKYSVISIESSRETMYPDLITTPFLMISLEFARVLHVYDSTVPFRSVILNDTPNKCNKIYQIPLLEQIEKEEDIDCQVLYFWNAGDSQELHIRKDITESLLRRGAIGLSLQEIKGLTRED